MNTMRDDLGLLWIVVCAEPRREAVANMNLLAAGLDTFWPHFTAMAWSRTGRKDLGAGIPVLRSYFPGYVFAAVENERHIPAIVRVRGVEGILWQLDDKHYLPPRWLSAMRAECLNDNGLHDPPDQAPARSRFPVGAEVYCRGPWEKFVATVLKDYGDRVKVSHGELFGKPLTATYDPIEIHTQHLDERRQ